MYTFDQIPMSQAHIAVKLEAGSGLNPGLDHTRPADVLVMDWALGIPAAFDITSPLTPAILAESSLKVGAAAERRKHTANDPKCAELGWVCVLYIWGEEARETFVLLVTPLAMGSSSSHKARVISDISKSPTGKECGACRCLINWTFTTV